MTKVFCPKCGNRTLKRVAVTLNEDGSLKMHFSRKPLTARGKQVSIFLFIKVKATLTYISYSNHYPCLRLVNMPTMTYDLRTNQYLSKDQLDLPELKTTLWIQIT
jgi:RNA-binding protein NOB1